jgi:DNA-binding beta-propeller fold protein YncE
MKTPDRGFNQRVHRVIMLRGWAALFALSALLLFPRPVFADEMVLKMDHLNKITLDEDENFLQWPTFVAVDPVTDEIYVLDKKNRFIIYTPDLFPLFTVGLERGIKSPLSLAIDMDGNIYVGLAGDEEDPLPRIVVIDPCLRWEREIVLPQEFLLANFLPYRMVVDKAGRILVTGNNHEGLLVVDRKGASISMIYPETEDGMRIKLTDISRDADGRIYLTSMEDGVIYVYDDGLTYLFKFGEKGGGNGKLSRPGNVAVDKLIGQMYVSDAMRHTILVYDLSGKYLYEFGGKGWGDGWFQYPRDLAVDKDGRLFIADTFNDRVSIFFPAKLPLDSRQKLFLADRLKGKISLNLPGKPTLDTRERIIDKIKDKITLYKFFDKLSLYTPENVPSFKKKEYIIHDIFNDKVSLNIPGKVLFLDRKWLLISDTITDKLKVGRPVYASAERRIPGKPTFDKREMLIDKFKDKIAGYAIRQEVPGILGDFIMQDVYSGRVSLNVPGKALFDSKRWLFISDTITDKLRAGRPVYASSETPRSNAPVKQNNISGKLNLDAQAKIVDRITEKIANYTTTKQAPGNPGDFIIQDKIFTDTALLSVPSKPLVDTSDWLLAYDKIRAGIPVYAFSELSLKPDAEKERRQ